MQTPRCGVVEVEYLSGPTWDEFLDMARHGDLDVVLSIVQSPERSEYLLFTEPYVNLALALYTRSGEPQVKAVEGLFGKTIALPEGFFINELVRPYPEIRVLPVANTRDAIIAVSTGRADATYDVMPVVNYLTRQLLITNLQLGGNPGIDEGEPIDLRIGVRKDWPILQGLLQKAMRSVSRQESGNLRDTWLGASPAAGQEADGSRSSLTLRLVAQIGLVFLLVGGAMVFVLRLMRRAREDAKVFSFGRIRTNTVREIGESLSTVVETSNVSLGLWVESTLAQLESDSARPRFVALIDRLQSTLDQDDGETAGIVLDELRESIRTEIPRIHDGGYQIIAAGDFRTIASSSDAEIGSTSVIAGQRMDHLRQAFAGASSLIPPLRPIEGKPAAMFSPAKSQLT